ncbi:Outer membrane protein assembly factor BamA [Ralstonia psammae]|uniref:Outer membrane protein assembly factor BamA n=1 Tax=Ralstonia psammae TaxID=3058598 RepID=A0ABM9J7F4_9RALS|nr:patatin-like phospholipase family protein [Ralstonia sp. LMG 19083]CAJ0784994.1 Outer membrane protein assembly factor BamA [Ralstonia sp. LMG 19083]
MAFLTAFLFRRRGTRSATAVLTALMALATLSPAVHGQTAAAQTPANAESTRPRIGLVLSGGGARGYAHIGVLRMLERMRIPVDVIAATSMGAVVGGLYASGMRADALEQKLSQVDLSDIAFDRNDRAKLPQSLREDDFQYPIGLSAGYGDGKLKLPAGLVQGNRLLALLKNWTAQWPDNIEFSRLPIPFKAMATDLATGDGVILDHGSLPLAMRASMAVPGLFAPIEVGGRTLVDGGLVSNLPVQLARDMGADIIIAVNIGSDLQRPEDLASPAAVTQQMITILVGQNVRAQKALLRGKDVLIEPQLSDLSFTDFAKGPQGVRQGERAAQGVEARLAALSLSPQAYAAYRAAHEPQGMLVAGARIDAIDVTTSGRVPAARVRQLIKVREGDAYDAEALNRELSALATTGDFETVTQQLVEENGVHTLKIDAHEKSWGNQFFLFGLGMSTNFDGRGAFNVNLGHRYPWLTQSGLEWRNDIVLGSNRASIHTELRQPLWQARGFYVAPYAEYSRRRSDLYFDDEAPTKDAKPFNSMTMETARAGVDLGIPLGRKGELRLGVNYMSKSATFNYLALTDEGPLDLPTLRAKQPAFRAQLTLDQLDDPLFPRSGYYFYSSVEAGFGSLDKKFNTAQAKGLWATSYGRHTFNVALEGAGLFGVNSPTRDNGGNTGNGANEGFFLGGFQHLSAYAQDQFNGQYMLYGRLTYLYDLRVDDLLGLRAPVFGASAEAGNVWQLRNNFGTGPYLKSGSVFVGGNSPIGPLYFGFAVAPQGVWNVYLQLGRVF